MKYNKYHIKETDNFDAAQFPKVQVELDEIREAAGRNPSQWKAELILSYLKQHALKKEWAEENPELTTLMTDSRFTTGHIEGLFKSCRQNSRFLEDFEAYIRSEMADPVETKPTDRFPGQAVTQREFYDS